MPGYVLSSATIGPAYMTADQLQLGDVIDFTPEFGHLEVTALAQPTHAKNVYLIYTDQLNRPLMCNDATPIRIVRCIRPTTVTCMFCSDAMLIEYDAAAFTNITAGLCDTCAACNEVIK
ncbi:MULTISPECIES: hypothetical protein [unclassified Amycolatopsis]|uniref:hypothetical protein n=1 Tax=unclassified Amycolatopsis TaxID=2618356 RepID=UPI00287590A1|nr:MULTISPECIES: hypothetical protein [unclassified Amycolatopsis]MDS0140616.1 hypothetical protein [Amycolatopsis sp. 505]MDS0149266.1 hypothetical protein [Amycolatopsis sp. CM201R]